MKRAVIGAALSVLAVTAVAGQGGRGNQGPGPSITSHGQTWTQQSLFQRNVGGPDDMTTAVSAAQGHRQHLLRRHEEPGGVPDRDAAGNILINSTYERNVPMIQKSIEQLGFKFSDIKILLGSHAHGDHQEGDAMVKQMTGAQVMAMAEDVPALEAMKPGGKAASDRSRASRRRHGDARRHDADGASHAGPHARLHDLDAEGAGGRQDATTS